MNMLQAAIILAITNHLLSVLDNFMSWDATWRPLFVGFVTGTVLRDSKTGLIMGAQLEAIYMGISAIGGVTPSDPESGTMIPVAYVILTGADMGAALALAVPVGALIEYFTTLCSPLHLALLGLYDKYAAENKQKEYIILHYLYCTIFMSIPRTLAIFLAVYLGVGNLGAINEFMPLWLINGLDVASGMLTAVGFGILTSMIWSPKFGIFFFVGFVLSELMGLSTIGITVIAAAIAISMFLIDIKVKEASDKNAVYQMAEEEDLF